MMTLHRQLTVSRRPAPRGAVLLLSVLLLASMTAIVTGLSLLIFTDLRSNRSVDDSAVAYYRAEQSLEKALEIIKVNRTNGHCSLVTSTRCQNDADCGVGSSCIASTFAQTVNDATFPMTPVGSGNVTTEPTSELTVSKLSVGTSTQIPLYDPDNLLNPTGIKFLRVTGQTTGGFLEVTWSGWDSYGKFVDAATKWLLSESDLETLPVNINLLATDASLVAFQVTFKALTADVTNLTVTPLDNGSSPVDLPTQLSVKSVALVGESRVALSAIVPWRLPASGLFDYVVFSVQTLKKE